MGLKQVSPNGSGSIPQEVRSEATESTGILGGIRHFFEILFSPIIAVISVIQGTFAKKDEVKSLVGKISPVEEKENFYDPSTKREISDAQIRIKNVASRVFVKTKTCPNESTIGNLTKMVDDGSAKSKEFLNELEDLTPKERVAFCDIYELNYAELIAYNSHSESANIDEIKNIEEINSKLKSIPENKQFVFTQEYKIYLNLSPSLKKKFQAEKTAGPKMTVGQAIVIFTKYLEELRELKDSLSKSSNPPV